MMDIYIYGCGGVGNEMAEILIRDDSYNPIGFIDDNSDIRECMGLQSKTLDELLKVKRPEEINVIISIGEPSVRKSVSKRLERYGINEVTVVLASHYNKVYSTVEPGCLLHLGVYIAVNSRIGRSCLINKETLIGHDCEIGQYTVLCPRVVLGGNVTIGEGTFIGAGAILRNGITIGNNVIIGMGSVVTKSVENEVVIAGNPAKIIRKNETHKVFKRK